MRDIVLGIVIIVIGLVADRSVFLGDFSVLSIVFDGLALFFIIRGIIKVLRSRQRTPS